MKKSFVGTEYKQDFFFYYDALSLMISSKTVNWTQQEGIVKHWILPEQGLNSGTQYANTPSGNAPKFNALDSNCNCDIHCTCLEHVSHTAHLQNTYEWKFLTSHGWKTGVPSSKQILEDLQHIPSYSILKQIKARGAIVHGCRTCRGHRADGAYQVENWGVEERIKQSVSKWEGNGQIMVIPSGQNNDHLKNDDDFDTFEF
eukprot:15092260-Ditylum_brightwellii.AAC.1